MKLIEVKGDLFDYFEDGTVQAIGHCCNCQNSFGAGIAATIKKKYPGAYKADTEHYKSFQDAPFTDPSDQLGTISTYQISNLEGVIFNLYGQDGYWGKRPVDYEMIYQALELMATKCNLIGIASVGFPKKMASDLAGGNWNVIKAMIEAVFSNTDITVYIVEYSK